MTTQFETRHIKVRPLSRDILVHNMHMGEQVTASGIIVKSDDGKTHGVKPRWAEVYKVGSECDLGVKVGEWILIEHGRWTRKIKIHDGVSEKEIQKVEVTAVMAVSDARPNDISLGTEYTHGSSTTIRPEDFGAR